MAPSKTEKEFWLVCYFATRHFRDSADGDYIMARMAHRLRLPQQFLWLAHQAVEKYLKAILLMNGFNAKPDKKKDGHDLMYFYRRVKAMPDLPVDFPAKLDDFVSHLGEMGMSRYLDFPIQTRGNDLLRLDESVWHLRRFCQTLNDPTESPAVAGKLRQERMEKSSWKKWGSWPCKFRLEGGHIEKILKEPGLAREHLVWKNAFFGTRHKRLINKFPGWSHFANSVPFMFRESTTLLNDKVHIPKYVWDYLKAHPPRDSIDDLKWRDE